MNSKLTISDLRELVVFEQEQQSRKLNMAQQLTANGQTSKADELIAQAYSHEKKAESYYITLDMMVQEAIGDSITAPFMVVPAGAGPAMEIVGRGGKKIERTNPAQPTPNITEKTVKEVAAKVISGEDLEYPKDDVLSYIYLAAEEFHRAAKETDDKEVKLDLMNQGYEAALNKGKAYFPEEVEEIENRAKVALDEDLKNKDSEDLIRKAKVTSGQRLEKELKTKVKSWIRAGQQAHVRISRNEALSQASAERGLTINSIQNIIQVGYWKNNKFNYQALVADETQEEDLIKLKAIHLHTIGKRDEAVKLLRTFYNKFSWDNLMAEQFLFALMNNGDMYTEVKGVVSGYIKQALGKSGNKGKNIKAGIVKSKRFLEAYFKTGGKDRSGKANLAVPIKKIDKMINDIAIELGAKKAPEAAA